MNSIKYTVSPDVLATKSIRFANFVIDYICILIVGGSVGVAIALLSELTGSYGVYEVLVLNENVVIEYTFGYFLWLLYYISFEALTKGRTLGKYITKTKVVLYDGSEPTFNEILVRSLCRLIPFEQFSFLGENGKGWHDSISKTYVIDIVKFEAKKATFEGLDEIGRIEE